MFITQVGNELHLHLFNRAQLPCPSNFNPADHYIHALAVTVGNEHECRNRVNKVPNFVKAEAFYHFTRFL